eukprot:gene4173-14274_t
MTEKDLDENPPLIKGHRYMTSVVLMACNPGRRNRLPTGGICPRASALSAADDAIQAAVLEAKSCQVEVDEIRASLSSTDLFTCDKGQRESLIAAQAAEIPGDVESSGESEDGSPAPSKSGTGVSTQALSDGTMGPVTALMGQVSTVAAPPDVPKVVSKSPDLAFLLAAEEKLHEAEIEVAILRSEKGQTAIELQRSKHALRLSKIQLRDLDDLRAAHLELVPRESDPAMLRAGVIEFDRAACVFSCPLDTPDAGSTPLGGYILHPIPPCPPPCFDSPAPPPSPPPNPDVATHRCPTYASASIEQRETLLLPYSEFSRVPGLSRPAVRSPVGGVRALLHKYNNLTVTEWAELKGVYDNPALWDSYFGPGTPAFLSTQSLVIRDILHQYATLTPREWEGLQQMYAGPDGWSGFFTHADPRFISITKLLPPLLVYDAELDVATTRLRDSQSELAQLQETVAGHVATIASLRQATIVAPPAPLVPPVTHRRLDPSYAVVAGHGGLDKFGRPPSFSASMESFQRMEDGKVIARKMHNQEAECFAQGAREQAAWKANRAAADAPANPAASTTPAKRPASGAFAAAMKGILPAAWYHDPGHPAFPYADRFIVGDAIMFLQYCTLNHPCEAADNFRVMLRNTLSRVHYACVTLNGQRWEDSLPQTLEDLWEVNASIPATVCPLAFVALPPNHALHQDTIPGDRPARSAEVPGYFPDGAPHLTAAPAQVATVHQASSSGRATKRQVRVAPRVVFQEFTIPYPYSQPQVPVPPLTPQHQFPNSFVTPGVPTMPPTRLFCASPAPFPTAPAPSTPFTSYGGPSAGPVSTIPLSSFFSGAPLSGGPAGSWVPAHLHPTPAHAPHHPSSPSSPPLSQSDLTKKW